MATAKKKAAPTQEEMNQMSYVQIRTLDKEDFDAIQLAWEVKNNYNKLKAAHDKAEFQAQLSQRALGEASLAKEIDTDKLKEWADSVENWQKDAAIYKAQLNRLFPNGDSVE